jgi:signal transduction histidine kinase
VELHGGRVVASSPGPGHGACFTIVLPAAETREPSSNPAS